ncbi:MAG TPA: LLM class flavin-dependent oxidoreductase [Candidatus Dormibacteraeota bacterium]|nr:LLM class flavin-dependent oxidoreductase [Candidatus Dormibacteraeota bacterium]
MTMKFGIWLPSYAYPDGDQVHRRRLRQYILQIEKAGHDIWVIDHLLHAEGLYGMSWLEPMSVLTYAAAITERAKLGTGILVLPLRNPVLLAKEIATLHHLSGERFMFGVGPGWYPPEFEVTGTSIEERGGRTDEIMEAVRLLLSTEKASFEGKYYRFRNVTIDPRPTTMPQFWVAGGSRIPDAEYHDVPVLAKSVLERILRSDAWLSRCSGTQEWVKRDWDLIKGELVQRKGTADGLVFGHCNFIYVVDTDDRERALSEQREPFEAVMGEHRSFEHLQQCYFMGTPRQQVDRLLDLESHGCEYVVLGPTTDTLEQLELLLELVIKPAQQGAAPAGA